MASLTTQQEVRTQWCCVQAGHREQYGIPRALGLAGVLDRLITDVWVPPNGLFSRLAPGRAGRRLRDRYHGDLPGKKVSAFAGRTFAWETRAKLRGWSAEQRVLARNNWWAQTASRALPPPDPGARPHLFSYCYEARDLFRTPTAANWIKVLGQIDPGPVEDRKVAQIVRRWNDFRTVFQPGTTEYYDSWREECRLAQHIIVNSSWSLLALTQAGIDSKKITVCPLIYTPPSEATAWSKDYPDAFSTRRPLRVLFLGQCILRKGIAEVIAAAQQLADRPVEFTLVGNTDIAALSSHFGRANIRYVPRVARAECQAYFRSADLFLFPTHSDGFGLTQLEAQAWKLPIVATRFCGEVVEHGVTGWVLPEVSSDAIATTLEEILKNPALLAQASGAIKPWPYDLAQLGQDLAALGKPELVTA